MRGQGEGKGKMGLGEVERWRGEKGKRNGGKWRGIERGKKGKERHDALSVGLTYSTSHRLNGSLTFYIL